MCDLYGSSHEDGKDYSKRNPRWWGVRIEKVSGRPEPIIEAWVTKSLCFLVQKSDSNID